MTFRNPSSKHVDTRIVSLAAGLALAAAAVIGGSDLLKEQSKGNSTTDVAPQIERTAQQFGTAADAVFASQGIRASSQFGTAADAVYAAQSLRPQTASVDVNNGSHLGLGQPSVGQSFATAADAVYAMQSIDAEQEQVSVAPTNLGNFLGLGQPDEGTSSEPQFGTMADADYASR